MPDGTTFEVVRSPADPERDPSEVAFTAQPGGPAPPPHIHPRQRETFTLEEGDFELLLGGDWRKLAPGESVTVEPGATHTYRNKGTQTARVRTVHEPGLSFEQYIRDLHATVAEHDAVKITPGVAVADGGDLAQALGHDPGRRPADEDRVRDPRAGRAAARARPTPGSAARADQPA